MKDAILYAKLDRALRWNSILFIVNKLCKTTASFLLFSKLSTADFSVWANIFSIVFVLALWLDFGMRKSLPLFCPLFAKNKAAKRQFIQRVIGFKAGISLLINILLLICTQPLAQLLGLQSYTLFFRLGCVLFLTESIKSVLRLIFHSHFWQKQFNVIESTTTTLNTSVLLVLSTLIAHSSTLLMSIFLLEIAAQLVLIAAAIIMLPRMHEDDYYQEEGVVDSKLLTSNFIAHSGMMWGMLIAASMTERNVLIPFFTYTLGPAAANIFKIANDGALFFARFILKTIGTSDTSFLAHLSSKTTDSATMLAYGVRALNKRVIALTLPLFGVILFVYMHVPMLPRLARIYDSHVTNIFLLLASAYLLQTLFLGYDRLLEIKQQYSALLLSSLPQLGVLCIVIFGITHASLLQTVGLGMLLLFFHGMRMVSVLIRIHFTSKLFRLTYPIDYLVLVAIGTMACYGIAHGCMLLIAILRTL